MINILEEAGKLKQLGYNETDANARICQDVVLDAISRSSLNRNVTVKGGVVMRSISANARRATQDVDIDFIRYSIADDSIRTFVEKIKLYRWFESYYAGKIEELHHKDYKGKRITLLIEDSFGNVFESKTDIGVHNDLNLAQEEYCFDISYKDDGVSLLMNSPEQMFTEKLRSLVRFGAVSTRYKDVFDLYYLSDIVNVEKLNGCIKKYILEEETLRVKTMEDILVSVRNTYSNKIYRRRLSTSKKNWIGLPLDEVIEKSVSFLERLGK